MPLPHSLFGAQVHESGKRHWWQRHPFVRKVFRRKPKPNAAATANAEPSEHNIARVAEHNTDRMTRDAERPLRLGHNGEPERGRSPGPAPTLPRPEPTRNHFNRFAAQNNVPSVLANGARDAAAEEAMISHFDEIGFDKALDCMGNLHPSVVLHTADAAVEAAEYEPAQKLYVLAHHSAANKERVPKHLLKLAQRSLERKDPVAQRIYLRAWVDCQGHTSANLSWGCLQTCVLNPALTREWYLRIKAMVKQRGDDNALEDLSAKLLRNLTYAMTFDGIPADVPLFQVIETRNPQLLTWAANGARVAGNLDLATSLDRRAQGLSAQ